MNSFNYVSFLWNIAESLRGTYKPEDYRKVMLPLVVLRRFDCLLEKYDREKMKSTYNEFKGYGLAESEFENLVLKDLGQSYGVNINFYNISNFNWKNLTDDSTGIESNFNEYIRGFSSNVKSIIEHFKFKDEIKYLAKKDKLYSVLKKFSEVDLSIEKVSNLQMGYIYEELIRKFSENSDAGEHYTPREIIKLCMEMLFYTKEDFISEEGKLITIADFCVGTGGMLSEAKRYIDKKNRFANVEMFGQENMDETFAVCQSDMIMKGENPNNIRLGNTLTEDRFSKEYFRFLISNPPYGVTWSDEAQKVNDEASQPDSRFQAGTPRTSDGSLLFLQNMISKMYQDEVGSRIAIILNGSPLFTGDAGSGESNIRKWIIESDLLEGIIALPTDMFYNTGISTYIWVLSNRKIDERKGKIQLVDGSSFWDPMRKSLGSKRKEISKENIKKITEIYTNFQEGEFSKIFHNEDFGYRKITVERPLKLKFQVTEESMENLMEVGFFKKLKGEQQSQLLSMLNSFDKEKIYMGRDEFLKELNKKIKSEELSFIKATQLKGIISTFGTADEEAEICRDNKGNVEADTSLRDSESIPLKEDVEEYFKREVKPHVPDAWIDKSTLDKIGYEIPFTRHFYKYEELRSFRDIMSEIESLEKELASEIHEIFN